MSKSLLAILVAIQISTQIVSESVSEIDASKISIQSRRKVMQENFEEIKSIKQKEELVKIEEENEIKEENNLQQCENQEEMNKQWVTFELSAYCPCEYCCDTYDGLVRLDIYCDSHEEALEFGRRVVEGYIVYH